MDEKCGTCRFWGIAHRKIDGPNRYAKCRRYPPTDGDPDGVRSWPETMETDWCGEYQPRSQGRGLVQTASEAQRFEAEHDQAAAILKLRDSLHAIGSAQARESA